MVVCVIMTHLLPLPHAQHSKTYALPGIHFVHPLEKVVLLRRVPKNDVHAARVSVLILRLKLRLQYQLFVLEIIGPVFDGSLLQR